MNAVGGRARRPQPGWHVFAWFLVLSGVERFAVEFLRINPPWILGSRRRSGSRWPACSSAPGFCWRRGSVTA